MSVFNSISETTDKATSIGEKYIKDTRQYYKLKVFQQSASMLSMVTKLVIVGVLALFAILFFAIAGAITIGHHLENMAFGYLIVGGILIVLTLIAYSLGSLIDGKILRKLSKKFFGND